MEKQTESHQCRSPTRIDIEKDEEDHSEKADSSDNPLATPIFQNVIQLFKDERFQTRLKPAMLNMLLQPISEVVANELDRHNIKAIVDVLESKRQMIDSLMEANAHLVETVGEYRSTIETLLSSEKRLISALMTTSNVDVQKTDKPETSLEQQTSLSVPDGKSVGLDVMQINQETVTHTDEGRKTNAMKRKQDVEEAPSNEKPRAKAMKLNQTLLPSDGGCTSTHDLQTNQYAVNYEDRSTRVKDMDSNEDEEIDTGTSQVETLPKSATEDVDDKMFESAWRNLADKEIDEGRKAGVGKRYGPHSVLCIDTSGSMNEGNTWSQVQRFYDGFLDGMDQLKEQDAYHDNIAVVTFGHTTKVQKRLTKNLASLRGLLDDITPQGPSPMFGGLVMAAAAAQTSKYSFAIVNNLHVRPKIILVTDGKPTELSLQEEPDVADPRKLEQTKKTITDEVDKLTRDQIDLHCIYVGESADRTFLRQLQSESVKLLMSYRDGEQMALYTVLKCMREGDQRFVRTTGPDEARSIFDKPLTPDPEQFAAFMKTFSKDFLPGLGTQQMTDFMKLFGKKSNPKSESAEELRALRTRCRAATITLAGNRLINVYKEMDDGKHPTIGTRVERSDDWAWGNQDNRSNGTIIGHATDSDDDGQCWVHVEWDDDESPEKGPQNMYRYKMDDDMEGDVRETVDDRVPPIGKVLAVGCRVIPGDGFKGDKTNKRGTVIRFHGNRAEVRWDDGFRGKYRFGSRAPEIVPMMEPDRIASAPAKTTHDVTPAASEDLLKIRVTERHIHQIAQTIPAEWEALGTMLGVPNIKMNHIAKDFQNSIVLQIVNMLNQWKLNTANPTLDVLVKAIYDSGVTFDKEELESIIREIRQVDKKQIV